MKVIRFKAPYDQYPDAPFLCSVYTGKETLDFACDNVYQDEGQVFVVRHREETDEGGDEYTVEDIVAIFPTTTAYVMYSTDCYRLDDSEAVIRDYFSQQKKAFDVQKEVNKPGPEDSFTGDKWNIPDDPRDLF